jgi:hypothetical protein
VSASSPAAPPRKLCRGANAQGAGDAELVRLQGARRIVIKGAVMLTVDPQGGDFAKADILIEDGKIREIRPDIAASSDIAVVDADNRIVIPGFVDTHSCLNAKTPPVATMTSNTAGMRSRRRIGVLRCWYSPVLSRCGRRLLGKAPSVLWPTANCPHGSSVSDPRDNCPTVQRAGAPAAATDAAPLYIEIGDVARAPMGWVEFCASYLADGPRAGSVRAMTGAR